MAVAAAPIGSIIKARATDPVCKVDIPSWARLTGNEVLEIVESDDGITMWVKKIA